MDRRSQRSTRYDPPRPGPGQFVTNTDIGEHVDNDVLAIGNKVGWDVNRLSIPSSTGLSDLSPGPQYQLQAPMLDYSAFTQFQPVSYQFRDDTASIGTNTQVRSPARSPFAPGPGQAYSELNGSSQGQSDLGGNNDEWHGGWAGAIARGSEPSNIQNPFTRQQGMIQLPLPLPQQIHLYQNAWGGNSLVDETTTCAIDPYMDPHSMAFTYDTTNPINVFSYDHLGTTGAGEHGLANVDPESEPKLTLRELNTLVQKYAKGKKTELNFFNGRDLKPLLDRVAEQRRAEHDIGDEGHWRKVTLSEFHVILEQQPWMTDDMIVAGGATGYRMGTLDDEGRWSTWMVNSGIARK